MNATETKQTGLQRHQVEPVPPPTERWTLDGRELSVGDTVEVLCPNGEWIKMMVDNFDCGTVTTRGDLHGRPFFWVVSEYFDGDKLRWPRPSKQVGDRRPALKDTLKEE